MQFCQEHWDKLRTAINDRGLSALVADSGEEIATKQVRELSDGLNRDNYDPLMSAHWAIANTASYYLLPELALQLLGGPHCPICFPSEMHDKYCHMGNACGWEGLEWMIDRAADDQIELWKELNG